MSYTKMMVRWVDALGVPEGNVIIQGLLERGGFGLYIKAVVSELALDCMGRCSVQCVNDDWGWWEGGEEILWKCGGVMRVGQWICTLFGG